MKGIAEILALADRRAKRRPKWARSDYARGEIAKIHAEAAPKTPAATSSRRTRPEG